MEHGDSTFARRRITGKVGNLPVLATLALWQMRQVWRLFGLIALGMLAALVLVGTVPLFAQVNTTASVRATFRNAGYDTSSTVQVPLSLSSSFIINKTIEQLKQDYRQVGSPFFNLPPATSLHLTITEPDFNLEVHGYDFGRIASHIHVLQGRLPQTARDGVEVVMTEDNAQALGLHVGSTYTIYANGIDTSTYPPTPATLPVTLKVAGVLKKMSATAVEDPFWHGDQLNYQQPSGPPFVPPTVTILASNIDLLAMFDQLARVDPRIKVGFNTQLYVFFPLDVDAITSQNVSQLPPLISYFTNQEPGKFNDSVSLGNAAIDNTAISTILGNIGDQRVVVQVPVLTLLSLMLGLILFFELLVTELLVTRQAEMIALTRSRGATMTQVFLPYVVQSLLLSLLVILIAPLLIPLMVRVMVMALFPPVSQSALNVLPATPWDTLRELGWYVWITVAMLLLTMCMAVWRTLRSSTLGRSTLQTVGVQRPLWQRLYADVLLALLGVLTYGLYTYLTSLGIIDAHAQILLAGPCMLVAATLLCLAGALLFLRAFPWLVRLGAKIAAKGRGIVPLFSLVVIARAPRQAMRSALLLIFTIAFTLFAQVFLATQQQRTVDLATYIAAADVSGQISQYHPLPGATFEQQERRLQKIPGTLSAALALVADETFPNANSQTTLTVIATDPASFGSSIIWPQVDNQTSIEPMLSHLADQRATLLRAKPGEALPPVPAIVSTATKNLLHLSVGQTFLAGFDYNTPMTLVDIGEIPYLPGVPNISQDQGVLVDYGSYTAAYKAVIPGAILSPTTAWVHVKQDAASLAMVRRTLTSSSFPFEALTFHHDVLAGLQYDPLYLNLICVLALGIGLTLLLAWVGCLTSAWLYVRNRLRSLLVLRSLGTTPVQLGLLLCWEQMLIFATAIVLGIACGAGFTALALPNVVFSSTAQLGTFATTFVNNIFQVQSTSLQLVIPPTVWLGLGVVALICATGIGITAITVARLSPAQMLRLSEDYVEEAPLPPERRRVQAQKEGQDALAGGQQGLLRETQLGRALTPVRRLWSALGLTQLGVLVSVLFVCVVPLFSQIAATAGLRDVLALPASRYITATTSSLNVIPPGHVQATLTQATNALNQAMFGQAAPYFHEPPFIALSDVNVSSSRAGSAKQVTHTSLTFASLSEQYLASQVKMVQGHISRVSTASDTLQIMLTPQATAYLHMHVGDILTRADGHPFDMQLVGLFQPGGSADTLLPINFFYYSNPPNRSSGVVTALASTEGLAQAVDAFGRTRARGSNYALTGNATWSYALDETVTSNQLDDLVATLSTLHVAPGYAKSSVLALSTLNTPLAALEQYQQSVVVSSVPIVSISVLIIALILLFLSFMVDLLVEREASTIAVLRSRGATHRQIFAAFLKRTLFINGIGLLAGIILAIPAVILLTRLTLQPVDLAGLSLLANRPAQVLFNLTGFALASTVVTLLAMGLALAQATRADYLALRREATRTSRKPFWQRWYLDVVGMAIALTAYGYSLYLTNAGVLAPAINVQVKAPLVLTTTIFLVLTCSLFLLRLYPLLLRLGARLAMRNRGVEPMLALSQMARAPRQRLRTALLLMFTTAFVVFAVVFAASQNQHIDDVARYWAGADFNGSVPTSLTAAQARQEQKAYLGVKGVTFATLGHVETLETDVIGQEVTMLAVDPQSFMHTMDWPTPNASQQQTLAARLNKPDLFPDLSDTWLNAIGDALPAVVDARTAQELHVTPGQSFTLGVETFFEVAEVKMIPTVNDLSTAGSTGSSAGASAGILVDYRTYNLTYQSQNHVITDIPIDTVWLKTDGSTQSLQHVRKILESGPLHLTSFYDRQASAQALNRDPLNLNLVGILFLGALAPLLLTWIGCLMASWVDMRQRQLLFGVLRALGSTPRQLAKVLSWEQALIFGSSVLLGTLFGLLMAFLALPSLVLTSVLPRLSIAGGGSLASSVQDLFSVQGAPGVHTVIPLSLAGVVLALVALAALAVILITRSAARIALGQALRLNED